MNCAEKLLSGEKLTVSEFEEIIINKDEFFELFKEKAFEKTNEIFGDKLFVRGLIEISNVCKNDCLYCGIRKSNDNVTRYALSDADIIECCTEGYEAGFKSFVLQGGEIDKDYSPLVKAIKEKFPQSTITLSLGEKSKEEYKKLKDAGADRYLLRHETADEEHYKKLHPADMNLQNRMECLKTLKELGFQTGCGFMVGSPYQSPLTLAKDLFFIQEFKPYMVGIGPFIPQADTPFGNENAGSAELTLYLLSVLRLMLPDLFIPATTALESLSKGGRERGLLHGANVIIPNISPIDVREKYQLYDNKFFTKTNAEQVMNSIKEIKFKTICEE